MVINFRNSDFLTKKNLIWLHQKLSIMKHFLGYSQIGWKQN
jgi:hypothetical protein